MAQHDSDTRQQLHSERWTLLEQINTLTDKPMIALSFVWLGLLILDLTRGLSPILQTSSTIIWALFALDFGIELIIAPDKRDYLKRNWLTAVSLLLPALRIVRVFRIFRVLRAARAARSVSLLRVVTSLNRGMRAAGKTLGQRGVGYVIVLTVLVTFGGAAGMYAFESPVVLREAGITDVGLATYGEAVWWTAMIMTTMGSEYWPQTAEGRILGWLLAVYAFAIFGYITATIASHFIGQDAAAAQPPAAGNSDIAALREEIALLRRQLTGISAGVRVEVSAPSGRGSADDQAR